MLKYFEKHRHATWLELFFDLVFVAAIGFVTHDLAHTHDNHLSSKQILLFPLQFIPIWWIWATHTVYSNRFDTDSKRHRFATLLIMLLLVIMATFLGSNIGQRYSLFVFTYVLIRFIIAGSYFNSAGKHSEKSIFTKQIGIGFAIGALICGSSIFFEEPLRYVVFYVGIIFDLTFPIFLRDKLKSIPIHLEHLVERSGLLIIILLGESVISLVNALQGEEWDVYNAVAAMSGFIMIGAIWWVYFDSFNRLERAKRTLTGMPILYAHLIVCMGLIILANVIRHAILQDLDNPYFGVLAITGMVMFYLGKEIPYYILFPTYRFNLVVNTTVCIAITVFSTFLPRTEYALVGITMGMLFYVYSNYRWVLSKDVSQYLRQEA